VDRGEVWCKHGDRIQLAQDMDQWQAVVNALMNPRVPAERLSVSEGCLYCSIALMSPDGLRVKTKLAENHG
jgi:hypothetical protein